MKIQLRDMAVNMNQAQVPEINGTKIWLDPQFFEHRVGEDSPWVRGFPEIDNYSEEAEVWSKLICKLLFVGGQEFSEICTVTRSAMKFGEMQYTSSSQLLSVRWLGEELSDLKHAYRCRHRLVSDAKRELNEDFEDWYWPMTPYSYPMILARYFMIPNHYAKIPYYLCYDEEYGYVATFEYEFEWLL